MGPSDVVKYINTFTVGYNPSLDETVMRSICVMKDGSLQAIYHATYSVDGGAWKERFIGTECPDMEVVVQGVKP